MSATATASIAQINPLLSGDKKPLVQSWFPLVRAADLKKGRALTVDVLGHAIVVFRSPSNVVGALKRACCHMGGDLSRGRVTNGGLRCPIHAWEFGVDGERLSGGSNESNDCARQPSLTCIEQHGIVFGFFGPRVLFDIPTPEESVFLSSVIVKDFDAAYDVPTLFGFDTEHFATVHDRDVESMEFYSNATSHIGTRICSAVDGRSLSDRLMRAAGLSTVDIDIDYWGANIMLGHHKRSHTYAFLTTLPLAENRLRMFIAMMQRRPESNVARQVLSRIRFAITQPVIKAFIQQDEMALKGVRFNPNRSLLDNNSGVQRWLAHEKLLAKVSAARIFHAD